MADVITTLSNLFNPQVVADKIATDYGKYITVQNYFTVENNLVGKPGDTLTRNQYNYIGDAAVLAEGVAGAAVALTAKQVSVKIVKVNKEVKLTDEAILSGADNPFDEATQQLAMSIALKDEADAVAALLTGTKTATGATTAKAIVAGMKVFGEAALRNPVYCLANSADYFDMLADIANWVPASELAASKIGPAVVGQYMGALVIPTDNVTAAAPILMMAGAGRKEMKRSFIFETQRDLAPHEWLLDATEHRTLYLYNTAKVVKLTVA